MILLNYVEFFQCTHFMEKKNSLDPVDIVDLCSLKKCIINESDMKKWILSPAFQMLNQTLLLLNNSVRSIPRSTSYISRPIISKLLEAITCLFDTMKEIKPNHSSTRYGNYAFRSWLTQVWEKRSMILEDVTDNHESQEYFCQSFGSWTRIDFGTGHELNFLAFISTLFSDGILLPEDAPAIVFDVFWSYYDLTIALQTRYNLEPAGSHGSWGVDDYVALPFVFGSSQLIDHPKITPLNVIEEEVAAEYKDDYLYCRWIYYIHQVKKGPFSETARILYSIKDLPHFQKLNNGMLKMYKGEIFDRYLVIRHFRFGEILKWE